MSAVSDAGPIIHLSWLDQLDLLRELFGDVLVPAMVRHEVLRARHDTPGMTAIEFAFTAGWLRVQAVSNMNAAAVLESLDAGEAEAIALMLEVGAKVLLIDDNAGRREAAQLGLPITGTIGVLRMARDRGYISAVTPLLLELRQRGFRISESLLLQIQQDETS